MRILVINGSPRKQGNVATLLRAVTKDCDPSTVRWYDVNDLQIHACTGCMKCRATGTCVLPHDDAHLLAEEMRQCDALVLGTPVYWGNMSGQMKLLFDRIVPVMMGENKMGIPIALHRGKKAIIVSTCTTIWPFSYWFRQITNAFHAMKEILHYSGFKVVGKLALSGTKGREGVPERLIKKGERLGKKISMTQHK